MIASGSITHISSRIWIQTATVCKYNIGVRFCTHRLNTARDPFFQDSTTDRSVLADRGGRYIFRPVDWETWEAWRCCNCFLTTVSLIFFDFNCWDVHTSPLLRFLRCKITAGVGKPFPSGVERRICNASNKDFPSLWDLTNDSFTV